MSNDDENCLCATCLAQKFINTAIAMDDGSYGECHAEMSLMLSAITLMFLKKYRDDELQNAFETAEDCARDLAEQISAVVASSGSVH